MHALSRLDAAFPDLPPGQPFEAARLQLKAFELGIGVAEQIFICGNHEASRRSPAPSGLSGLVFVAVIAITVDDDAAGGREHCGSTRGRFGPASPRTRSAALQRSHFDQL